MSERGVVDIMSPSFRARYERRQLAPVDATPTPLATWNSYCRDDGGQVGLARWFVVVAGNPKFGKSILALNLAFEAMKHGPVAFMSLEMSAEQLASRFYALATRTPIYKLEKGGFNADAFRVVWQTLAPLANDFSFYVDDTPVTNLAPMLASMHELREAGVRWYVIDYLQLVGVGSDEEIYRKTSEVTTTLRLFANSTDSTVVALSQFNRETSKNYDTPPRAQGCHGGAVVEQTADQVILLDHSRWERDETTGKARSYLIVDLNRHGLAGPIPIEWDFSTLSIREGLPDEERFWPGYNARKK